MDSSKASSCKRTIAAKNPRSDRRLESSAGTARRCPDQSQRRVLQRGPATNFGTAGCLGRLSAARPTSAGRHKPQRPGGSKKIRGFRHDRRQNDKLGEWVDTNLLQKSPPLPDNLIWLSPSRASLFAWCTNECLARLPFIATLNLLLKSNWIVN